ncbi:hypothetical protein A28LD_1417 [Idiomarina sp. A28L]|uniref:hypothetical protein n=1 Tax=Idiomarina sp. A28L TaxID=1036674 RepID=UPI000213892B|nr:hypothetical protein [Idiomarina sp. A28L]EGN74956.1 hypothetical protein A28LD_1417 [Idiomarina sp. A28L]
MSKLDKEQVLADFSAAYKKAHGKAPKVEDNSGWYSIDGGKNVRLAEVAELTAEYSGKPASKKDTDKKTTTKKDTAKKAAKPAKSTAKKEVSKKATSKKSTAKQGSTKKAATAKPKAKKAANSGGLTAKEQWKEQLEASQDARLPRGMQ